MMDHSTSDSELHAEPPVDEGCLVCYDNITSNAYVEYQTEESSPWYPCKFCVTCLEQLQTTQFDRYYNALHNSRCAREQRALLKRGPPINLFDKNGFPEAGDNEVYALWYASDRQVKTAKLAGSLTGEARMKLWEEAKHFMIKGEHEEDEEEEEEELKQVDSAQKEGRTDVAAPNIRNDAC